MQQKNLQVFSFICTSASCFIAFCCFGISTSLTVGLLLHFYLNWIHIVFQIIIIIASGILVSIGLPLFCVGCFVSGLCFIVTVVWCGTITMELITKKHVQKKFQEFYDTELGELEKRWFYCLQDV